MMVDKQRITKRSVDSLKEGNRIWDTALPGFCVRRQREAKSYAVKYRNRPDGRQRLMTIGKHGQPDADGKTWTPERARFLHHRSVPAFAVDGLRPNRASERMANRLT
jgi:hypothetical protein